MSIPRKIFGQGREDAAETAYLLFLIQWSTIALVWYDYALTFNLEVKYVWCQGFRFSTILYIFCRSALIANILGLFAISTNQGRSYEFISITKSISPYDQIANIVTFTIRTYAVCNQDHHVLAYLGVLGFVWMVVSIWHMSISNCEQDKNDYLVGLLDGIIMCIFEFSSAIITFFRYAQNLTGVVTEVSRSHCFSLLILEQGILYFVLTAFFSIATLFLYNRGSTKEFSEFLVFTVLQPMSCILTARFLLHLRRLKDKLECSGASILCGGEIEETADFGSLRSNVTAQLSSITMDLGVGTNVNVEGVV